MKRKALILITSIYFLAWKKLFMKFSFGNFSQEYIEIINIKKMLNQNDVG